MELEFDFPSDIESEQENEKYCIDIIFKLCYDIRYPQGEIILYNIANNKEELYNKIKTDLSKAINSFEDELRKAKEIYNDLENLSIDEFEKKYLYSDEENITE